MLDLDYICKTWRNHTLAHLKKQWTNEQKLNWNSPKWPNKVSNPLHHSACVKKSMGACRNIGQPFASMAWLVWFTEVKILTPRISLPKKPETTDLNFRSIFSPNSAFGECCKNDFGVFWEGSGDQEMATWQKYVSTGDRYILYIIYIYHICC